MPLEKVEQSRQESEDESTINRLNQVKNILRRPTFLLLFGTVALVVGIPYTIWISLQPEIGILTVPLVLCEVIIIGLIVVDRIAVRKVKPIYLSVIEMFLLALYIGFVAYNNRKIEIDVSHYKENYLITFVVDNQIAQDGYKWSFPFNKRLLPSANYVLISEKDNNQFYIELVGDDNWTGMYSSSIGHSAEKIYFKYWRKKNFKSGTSFDSLLIRTYRQVDDLNITR